MLGRIFPRQFDNQYRGHWLGLLLFVLVLVVKSLQGIESIIQTEQTMIRADGIPLATFSPVASQEAILMFALLGMYLLVIPVQSIVVLVRYRSMVPFMLLMLIVIQLGVRTIHLFRPDSAALTDSGPPIGFYVNLGILGVTIIAFALSLIRPHSRSALQGVRP
jgi:hypothetical protein